MLELNVRVPSARDRTGVAVLRDGSRIYTEGPVAASATSALAARRGNRSCDPLRAWGHPPFGRYRLLHHAEARPELKAEYGAHLFLFEPESGQALEAESFGRLALLAYGGAVGSDGMLRSTQGGLRLGEALVHALFLQLREAREMRLELAPSTSRAWWQFWRRPDEAMPLSRTLPEMPSPPDDEPSVIEELLAHPALVRRPRRGRDDRRDQEDDRDDRRRSSSSDDGSRSDRFEGRGGESAGAGASGGWDSAPGRAPGVDQAGRIVAGAAAAAGLAALASEAANAGSRASATGDGSGSDSPTTTSTAY